MANESFANSLVVEVASKPLPADVKTLLTYAYVDDSRNLPDTFVRRFRDPDHVVLAKGKFKVGEKIDLKVQTADPGGPEPLLSGEITAVGIDLDRIGTFTEVRGYDHAHRLFRGRRVAVYPNMTVSDVVRKVAQRAKIPTGTVDNVAGVGGRQHVQFSQDNISDWEFLTRLANAVGAQIAVRDGKLNFQLPEKPDSAPGANAKAHTDPLVLEAHRNLITLRAGLSAGDQVPEVRVNGWDVQSKKETSATATPKLAGTEVPGVDPAELGTKFGSPPMRVATPSLTQSEADAAAKALAAQLGSACLELDGMAKGNPKLRAGTAITLANVGEPFAGKYTLTSTRHVFSDEVGYATEFTVSGRQERSLYGLATGGHSASPGVHNGLVPAIVSDARDPAKLGRLKLSFPWLDKDYTSNWARVAQPGAGKARGTLVLPEVGDEVLVGFEHGDFDAPYVLGGLHNGMDPLPTFSVDPVDGGNGEIAVRGFVSRKGHKVELVENTGITIASGDGKLIINLDQKKQLIEVISGKEISVKAANGIKVDSGNGPLELKGQKVTVQSATDVAVDAQASMKLSGQAGVKVEGSTVSVTGQGQAELTASGTVTVRGGLVRIN